MQCACDAPLCHHTHARSPRCHRYVGVGGEEWRRMQELMSDYNVTYVQLIPRVGLSAGRNALVEACTTK